MTQSPLSSTSSTPSPSLSPVPAFDSAVLATLLLGRERGGEEEEKEGEAEGMKEDGKAGRVWDVSVQRVMEMISAEQGRAEEGGREVNVSEEDEEEADGDVQWVRVGLDSSDDEDGER